MDIRNFFGRYYQTNQPVAREEIISHQSGKLLVSLPDTHDCFLFSHLVNPTIYDVGGHSCVEGKVADRFLWMIQPGEVGSNLSPSVLNCKLDLWRTELTIDTLVTAEYIPPLDSGKTIISVFCGIHRIDDLLEHLNYAYYSQDFVDQDWQKVIQASLQLYDHSLN